VIKPGFTISACWSRVAGHGGVAQRLVVAGIGAAVGARERVGRHCWRLLWQLWRLLGEG